MIKFTQFLRPDGRRKQIGIERTPDVEAIADKLVEAGCSFEIEVLRNGVVSMEVVRDVEPENDDDDGHRVLASEIVANGTLVNGCVDEMMRNAEGRLSS